MRLPVRLRPTLFRRCSLPLFFQPSDFRGGGRPGFDAWTLDHKRRSKQFGLVQPSTATRVDVGLNLKGTAPKGRLEASGSFNSMCTHRVRVETAKDVDAELLGWLRKAYDNA